MLPRVLGLSLCLCAGLFVVACGSQKDLAAADVAVTRFHQQLDSEDYAAIYTQADQRFRDVTKQDDFIALMTAVHRKLGRVGSATRQGFFVNYNTSGTRIRTTYGTKFSDGDAQEQFVWSKSGGNVALLGYNIQSNSLVVK
jgi:hypothetical protein